MSVHVGRTRIAVHPLALLCPLAAAMLGAGTEAAALVVALILHEGAHLLAARCLGVGIAELRLTPFGGAMAMDNPYALSPFRLVAVTAAGPLANALALVTAGALAHGRLISPDAALACIQVNLLLFAFNLLPALPLDGGRIAYGLLSLRFSREKALAAGIWAGRAVAATLVVACAAFFIRWRRINLSFLFAAVFILASAADERRALEGTRVGAVLGALRPLEKPVPARLWAVDAGCPARIALRVARPEALTLYAVYKGNRLSSITDDRRLLETVLRHGDSAGVEGATARPHPPGRAS